MLIRGPFILNGKRYSRASLLQFASAQMNDPGASAWEIALYQFISDLFDEEKPLVQQTSGTTGEPKSIVLKREAMLVSAQRTLDHFGLKPGDAALLCLPVQYIAGKMMVVRALLGGLNLVTVEPVGKLGDQEMGRWGDQGTGGPGDGETRRRGDGETGRAGDGETRRRGDGETGRPGDGETRRRGDGETGRRGDGETGRAGDGETRRRGDGETGRAGDGETKIDFAAMVPLQVYELLESPEIFSRIATLIIGGGEIDPAMRKNIRQLEGIKIYETFAMSETYTHFATRRLNDHHLPSGPPARRHDDEPQEKKKNKQKENFHVINESFQLMEGVTAVLDDRGCLVVDIPGVTDGPVVSNDLAELTGPHSFRWLGRIDNVIKTGGIKVIPETIEAVVKELTGREAVITSVPDSRLGQKLILVIEGDDPGFSPEELRPHLEKHEIPKEVFYLPAFPRNRSMKIDRAAIRQLLEMD